MYLSSISPGSPSVTMEMNMVTFVTKLKHPSSDDHDTISWELMLLPVQNRLVISKMLCTPCFLVLLS